MRTSSGIFAVKTVTQAALFEHELKGQLSDGMWENTQPYDHWQQWCAATVIVDPSNPGRDFWVRKDAYRFDDKGLLDVVGERMQQYARVAQAFGDFAGDFLSGVVDAIIAGRAVDDYVPVAIRRKVDEIGRANIHAVALDDSTYGDADLRADLRELRKLIKQRRVA